MAFNYDRIRSTASQLLERFGEQLTFTRTTQGACDPDTGQPSTSTSTFSRYCCVFDYSDAERAEQTIQEGDRRVLAEAGDYEVGDKVTIDSETYRVVNVSESRPSATIVSVTLQVRK